MAREAQKNFARGWEQPYPETEPHAPDKVKIWSIPKSILEALEDEGFQTDESMRDVEFDDIKSQNISEDSDEQKGNEDNDHECSHQKNSASKTKAREIFQKQ